MDIVINTKGIGNEQELQCQIALQIQFASQEQQFTKKQIPLETFECYERKLESIDILEIHLGLLGIQYITKNRFNYNLNNTKWLNFLLYLVEKDVCLELTNLCFSILQYLTYEDKNQFKQNFIENGGIQTLLLPHLIQNQEYFLEIINIFYNINKIVLSTNGIFQQAQICLKMIQYAQTTSSTQWMVCFPLMQFVYKGTDQCELNQICIFYEDNISSLNPDLFWQSLEGISKLLDYYKLKELNHELITCIFSVFKKCDCFEQNEIINYIEKVVMQQCCNEQLIQLGLFDLLLFYFTDRNDLKKNHVDGGIQIIINCVSNSKTIANKLVDHKLFQILLIHISKFELFEFFNRFIKLIKFQSLQNSIQISFLRVIALFLKELKKMNKSNINFIVEILQYIIEAGEFEENYFLYEIKQLGIIEALDSINVLISFSQALYFDNNQSYKLQE